MAWVDQVNTRVQWHLVRLVLEAQSQLSRTRKIEKSVTKYYTAAGQSQGYGELFFIQLFSYSVGSSSQGEGCGPGTIPAISGSSEEDPDVAVGRLVFISWRRAAFCCCFS